MSEPGFEQLTLFPEDSHASHFPWLESRRVKGMTVTSGLRCSALSASCARIALSVRTYLESSRLPPGRWSRIWSAQAITSSYSILKLRLSAHGTGEAGCSLWATPNTMDALPPRSAEATMRVATTARAHAHRPSNLREQIDPLTCAVYEAARGLLPTPTQRDSKGANSMQHLLQPATPGNKRHRGQLANVVKLLTTPCAADATGSTGGGNHRSLRTDIAGQLNPEFCEWLMGFPIGWTELSALETP